MELAHLKIIASAEVDKAIDGLEQTQGALEQTAVTSEREGGKMADFVDKYKMGWVVAGAAVAGVLYGIMKMSPIAAGYFAEFTAGLGVMADTVMMALGPALDWLMIQFWKFVEWFIKLDPWVHRLVGAFGILAGVATVLGLAWAYIIKPVGLVIYEFLKTKGVIELLKAKWALLVASIKVVIGIIAKIAAVIAGLLIVKILLIIGAVVVLYVAWRDNWFGIRDSVYWAWEQIKTAFQWIMDKAHDLQVWVTMEFNTLKTKVGYAFNILLENVTTIWNNIRTAIVNPIKSAHDSVMRYVRMMLAALARIRAVGGGIIGFQHGGVVPYEGLHYLHAGERVIPRGGAGAVGGRDIGGATTNITNTFNITGTQDARGIADEVSRIMADEVRRAI